MGTLGENIGKHIQTKKRGGRVATLFVYVSFALESSTFIGNAVSMFLYFYGYMNYSLTKSATMLTNYMGAAYLLSLFGGFVCDTFLSRFTSCVLFGSVEVLGYGILAAQAFIKELKPDPCSDPLKITCDKADSGQVAMLYGGLYLVALGTGGMKAALPSLGADQFDEKVPEEAAAIPTYFNWLFFSFVCGGLFGVTFLVWVSTDQGWKWGFGVSTLVVAASVLFLCTGSSFYRHSVPKGSPLTRIFQVFVAAFRNRNLSMPETAQGFHEIHDIQDETGIEIIKKSDQLKFLDRAAIIRTTDGSSPNAGPWLMCTVTQVEEAKIIVRMLPIIMSTIFMNTCLAQLQTFTIQQSSTLDKKVLGIHIPGPSITVLPLIFMFIAVPIYDRIVVPALRKLTGLPDGIRQLQRIGVGLVLSAISMAVAGYVEKRRKNVAIEHNMVDSPLPLPMNVLWLGFQYAIFGIADMFTLVGLLDFFYSESSAGMKSLGTAFTWSSSSIGYFLSTVIVNLVNHVSGGWFVSNNLNMDKLNYFYYLLSGLSVLNFGFYLLCSSWYRYKDVEIKQIELETKAETGNV